MSKIYPLPTRAADGAHAGSALSGIDEILAELRAGRMVVILDDEERENEGDLIMAAQCATRRGGRVHDPAYERHHLRADGSGEQLAQLELPQMVPNNDEAYRTAFTVSVDYRFGTSTGVSSADRAATIRALADPASTRSGFCATRTYLSAAAAQAAAC